MMYSQRFADGSAPSEQYLACLEKLKAGYFTAVDRHSEDELELYATIHKNKMDIEKTLSKLQKSHLKLLLDSLNNDQRYFSQNNFFVDKTGLVGLILSHTKNWSTGQSSYLVRWGARDPGESFVEQEIDPVRIDRRLGVFYES